MKSQQHFKEDNHGIKADIRSLKCMLWSLLALKFVILHIVIIILQRLPANP